MARNMTSHTTTNEQVQRAPQFLQEPLRPFEKSPHTTKLSEATIFVGLLGVWSGFDAHVHARPSTVANKVDERAYLYMRTCRVYIYR